MSWCRNHAWQKGGWGGDKRVDEETEMGSPDFHFLYLIHPLASSTHLSYCLLEKHRESVLMVCQIMLFSPIVDLMRQCVCMCVFVSVLNGSLAYFSLVVFSVDIAHSTGFYAFQCCYTHRHIHMQILSLYTLRKQYKQT